MDFTQKRWKLADTVQNVIKSELLPGALLLAATLCALVIANTSLVNEYHHFFETEVVRGITMHAFVNDFLMAIFFLVVGCEIKKEIVSGHLSNIKKASFPIVGAIGGVTVPAIIFYLINRGTSYSSGVGVPISTDIAFAIGAFMIFKKSLNPALKIFLLTLAVVDDLMSIIVIGVFYSSSVRMIPLIIAGLIMLLLFSLNKVFKCRKVSPYIILGLFLWYFIYQSGVHATISGVLLAMLIPIAREEKEECILSKIEHSLSPYANLIILPLFAFSNTAIVLNLSSVTIDTIPLSLGIIIGLVIGKPVGIILFTSVLSKLNVVEKPKGVKWKELLVVGMLAGIGFTMSIFVSEIAFAGMDKALDLAKISILLAAITSCLIAFITIKLLGSKKSYV